MDYTAIIKELCDLEQAPQQEYRNNRKQQDGVPHWDSILSYCKGVI